MSRGGGFSFDHLSALTDLIKAGVRRQPELVLFL